MSSKTPAIQALLKFLEGAIPAAVIAGILAAVPFLTGSTVSWRLAAIAVLVVAAKQLMDAGVVYFRAHGQAAAAAVLSAAASAVPAVSAPVAPAASAPTSLKNTVISPAPVMPSTPAEPVSNI